jgi:putative DNA primase/helicase
MSQAQNDTGKTTFAPPRFDNIPNELKDQRWAVWRAEPRDGQEGKFNKAPLSPTTGRKIGANKPELFGTFEEARHAFDSGSFTGVGVLLTGCGIVGVDIDDYRELFNDRPEVKLWIESAIKEGVYCERSPSGKGLRLFMRGELPAGGRKSGGLEIYDNSRFLTVTGHVLKRSKI